MCHDLGKDIKEGSVLTLIHETERTGSTPIEYRSCVDGIFMGRHFPCLIKPGDFLAKIAAKID
ncbi:MAG: hypothetical protein GY889_12980 [Proteobacteria bacterium]|nr:hypothetical protein [Pseudomonadota bacterium]HJP07623.1 hypothetical protein [Arenicellales bacterium]